MGMDAFREELTSFDDAEHNELQIEAVDLGGIDVLEEDIVPCSCCGSNCTFC